MTGAANPSSPRQRLWVLPVFVLGHLAVCFACVWALSHFFYLSGRVVLLHVSLLAGISVSVSTVLAYGLHRRWLSDRGEQILLSAAATTAVIMLTLLYLGDLAGVYFWSDNLNYQVVWQYASLMLPYRAPFYLGLWVYVVLFGVAVILFAGYWFCSKSLLSSLEGFITLIQRNRIRRGTALALSCILALAYTGAVGRLAWGLRESGLLKYEPIVGFFMRSDGLFDFSQYAGDRTRTKDGPGIRAKYQQGQSFVKKNVILIIVDSLRADHMSLYGYGRATTPFLSKLLGTGHLRKVELALSTCASTNCGVLSTLTSRPLTHLADGDFSLHQLLSDQGYEVYRILSGNHDWEGLRQVYGNDQTLYFDSTNSTQYPLNDDRVVFEALDHVPDFRGIPAFFQFHLMSVHATGVKHDAYRQYQPAILRRNFDWILKGDDQQVLTNNYDNGVLEADATIARLFEQLRKKGYLTNSLCIILSDHGEELGERGPLAVSHVRSLYQEDIRIPLLIYDEADVTYGNLTLARQIDVAPTIINRLGLQQPSSWEGRSLLDPVVSEYSYHQTRRWHACYAVVDHTTAAIYKYIRCSDSRHEALYNLTADPLEQHDLSPSEPRLMQNLRERLRDYLFEKPPQERVLAR